MKNFDQVKTYYSLGILLLALFRRSLYSSLIKSKMANRVGSGGQAVNADLALMPG